MAGPDAVGTIAGFAAKKAPSNRPAARTGLPAGRNALFAMRFSAAPGSAIIDGAGNPGSKPGFAATLERHGQLGRETDMRSAMCLAAAVMAAMALLPAGPAVSQSSVFKLLPGTGREGSPE